MHCWLDSYQKTGHYSKGLSDCIRNDHYLHGACPPFSGQSKTDRVIVIYDAADIITAIAANVVELLASGGDLYGCACVTVCGRQQIMRLSFYRSITGGITVAL